MKLIKDLPEIFEEFGEQRKKSFLEIKEYKERGIPVVGMYCAYFPTELAIAVGAIPVGLCSFANETVISAERAMPKSMCPLIKSSYGFALEDKCPFFHFADVIIGETTCDGKKKMYELMAEFKKIHVMELPNSQSESGFRLWEQQVVQTKEFLEEHFETVVTDENIRNAIRLSNQIRSSLKRLCEVMKLDPPPINGLDVFKILQGSKYRFDFGTTPDVVNAITDKILEEYRPEEVKKGRPRILVTGCPIGGDTNKIISAVENNGGVVVALENCSGIKTLDQMVDETDLNPYRAIARRYLATGCSIMTPNDNRIELIGRIIDEYKVDGVVEMILSGCHSTGAESIYIRKFVNDEKNVPYIAIDTDYSMADQGQINTRIAAFLEMICYQKLHEKKTDAFQCYKIMLSLLTQGKPMHCILEEIERETQILFEICDANGKELYKNDLFDEMLPSKYKIITEVANTGDVCKGICRSNEDEEYVKEILNLIVRGYMMNRDMVVKNTKTDKFDEGKKNPDYMWVALDREVTREHNLNKVLKEHVCCHRYSHEDEKWQYFLFSNLMGMNDRNEIILELNKYSKKNNVCVVVGTVFRDLTKKEINRRLLNKIFLIGQWFDPEKKVYLAESYYQELSMLMALENSGKKSFKLAELEFIRKKDAEKGTQLYKTLESYIFSRRNMTQTALQLGIHRNTLLYRMIQIKELLCIDGVDELDYVKLTTAIIMSKIIEKNE